MADSFTPAQSRAGRALVAWSQQDLALKAKVAASTVADFERGERTPVPNNIEAMRSALESAGVRLVGGGVIVDAPLSAGEPHPLTSGSPIRWINSSDLQTWADRRDGQAGMAELISRLILAAYGHGARLRFPAGDSIQFAGWDGFCEVGEDSYPVPAGISAWEIGTQRQGVKRKADEDFQKRTSSPGLDPTKVTYMAVTPRPWPGKTEWAEAKRSEGQWADVQAIDGDDLIHWIERYPSVAHWLATRIGKRPLGLLQLSEVWEEWSRATSTPLTTEVLLAGRDDDEIAVLKWLRGPPELLSVQAEAVDEALAFLFAAICELPLQYRGP